MRLWHEKLIPILDNKRLLGQHRECCALRGLGWGRKHSVVDYVFKHSPLKLYAYHLKIMEEMTLRGMHPAFEWSIPGHRGRHSSAWENLSCSESIPSSSGFVYFEHDNSYLDECIVNLESKNARSKTGISIRAALDKLEKKGS